MVTGPVIRFGNVFDTVVVVVVVVVGHHAITVRRLERRCLLLTAALHEATAISLGSPLTFGDANSNSHPQLFWLTWSNRR